MERTVNSFPVQRLPYSKKNDEWRKDCVDYIIGASDMASTDSIPDEMEMQSYYDLYNSIYNEKDLKYVTNPFHQDDGFPATAQDYNIIRPKIDLLLGEETKRPFNFKVCRTSDMASSEIQEKAKQMILNYMYAAAMAKMSPEEQAQFEQGLQTGEIQPPEEIQRYLTKDYKDIAEITAYQGLKYLIQKENLVHEFTKGFKHALIAGVEPYYVGVRNGEPICESVNPKDFKYPAEEGVEFIHDASWCLRRMFMSWSQLYDQFYDKLDEKQQNQLLEMVKQTPSSGYGPDRGPQDDFVHYNMKTYSTLPSHNPYGDADVIAVYHVCWRSLKKIGFVTFMNPETEMPEELEVDEFYKPTGMELSIEWRWIIEIWEGYKADMGLSGDDLYFGIQPLEYQFRRADNLNSCRLPYTGAAYSNTNSKAKSLVAVMKPLQYMYIILWYRLELAIARDKGRIPVIDVTQIPKSMGVDIDKWMHYLSALGVAFINPYENSMDIPGREAGRPATYNQWSTIDTTMANSINMYISLLDKIEEMVSELSGVSKQRQGAISTSELVGNVERSVVQSAHITEPWFWLHNQIKKNVLIMLLDTAKYAWNGTKQYLNYIYDEGTRVFLQLDEGFPYEDFDIFVSDSSKENQIIEQLHSMLQSALTNGSSLLDIAEVLSLDSLNMIKAKLQEIEQKRMEQQQAMQEQEAQQQQQAIQLQNQVKEEELQMKQAELELSKYKVDQDNATRITVAQLQAYRYSQDLDQDNNGIPDPIEIGNQEIERQKAISEAEAKRMETVIKARAEDNKRDIEKRKVDAQKRADELKATIEREKMSLERRKLEEAKKLQKMKDQAAMEREKLKARTALRNKVAGEK